MTRRQWLGLLTSLGIAAVARNATAATPASAPAPRIEPLLLTAAQWRQRLTREQFHVLREDGTEYAGSSPLNHEKRKGRYLCAGCDLPLFSHDMKYDSGTGWPSFFTSLPGAVKVQRDFGQSLFAGLDYRCARCGGHHGHVFNDGPKPTGLRYCNNGVALKFQVEAA